AGAPERVAPRGRRLRGLPAAGAVPPPLPRRPAPDHRGVPRLPAAAARGAGGLPPPLDRAALPAPGARLRPAGRARDRVLRQRPDLTFFSAPRSGRAEPSWERSPPCPPEPRRTGPARNAPWRRCAAAATPSVTTSPATPTTRSAPATTSRSST